VELATTSLTEWTTRTCRTEEPQCQSQPKDLSRIRVASRRLGPVAHPAQRDRDERLLCARCRPRDTRENVKHKQKHARIARTPWVRKHSTQGLRGAVRASANEEIPAFGTLPARLRPNRPSTLCGFRPSAVAPSGIGGAIAASIVLLLFLAGGAPRRRETAPRTGKASGGFCLRVPVSGSAGSFRLTLKSHVLRGGNVASVAGLGSGLASGQDGASVRSRVSGASTVSTRLVKLRGTEHAAAPRLKIASRWVRGALAASTVPG
jgi:hypothetical protein